MPQAPYLFDSAAIIGGGKMGEAILAGLLGVSGAFPAAVADSSCVVVNPGEERRAYLSARYGVSCLPSVEALGPSELVVLAVKPQVLPDVLAQLAASSWLSDSVVVSVAAGVTTKTIESALPAGAQVVRAMPNLPLTVGRGMVAISAGASASEEALIQVKALFHNLGHCIVTPEDSLDAVTALSGSGPAYVAALIEAMTAAGVEEGLGQHDAEQLALYTVDGTAALLLEGDVDAPTLRRNVSSPGGTTLAALSAMEQGGFSESIRAGVHAAAQRSKELSQ